MQDRLQACREAAERTPHYVEGKLNQLTMACTHMDFRTQKVAEQYPPPPTDDPPPPTFRQALVGYGSIIAALVALGVLIGVLIKVLR